MEGIVHEETQVRDRGIDLTLAEVYGVDEPGRVEFGGGELEDAALSPHERVLRDPDDEWWDLASGQYLIEYDERLDREEQAVLQTRDEVLARGAFHPTSSVAHLQPMPLSVAPGGLQLKENDRVSTVYPAGSV